MPDGNAVLPLGGLSALRRWAEKHVVVGDGPRAGSPFKIGCAPWGEVLDSMDDPESSNARSGAASSPARPPR